MANTVRPIPSTLHESEEGPESGVENAAHEWLVRVIKNDGDGILRMLWRILGCEADVMDAYQDCFCHLAARGKEGEPSNPRAYAYRAASNIATEMLRSRRRRRGHWSAIVAQRPDSESPPPADNPAPLAGESLGDAISELPAHLRNVIILRDLCRMPYNEVGRMLGIEPATARVYRRHAVVKLSESVDAGNVE